MSINLVALGVTLLIFLVFYTTFSREVRHPVNLYLLAWMLVFILLEMPFVKYIDVSFETYAYIILSILMFSTTAMLWGTLRRHTRKSYLQRQGFFISTPLLLFFGTFSLAVALNYYQSRFGLVELLLHPGVVRAADTGGTGFLGLLVFMPTVIFTLLIIQARLKRHLSWPIGLYLLVCAVYMLILPERTTAINTLIWTILSVWSTNPRSIYVGWNFVRRYLLAFSIIPILIIGFFVTVSARTHKVLYLNSIGYALNVESGLPTALYDPYIYMTGSIPALGTVVDQAITEGHYFSLDPQKTAIFPRRIYQIFTGGQDDEKLTSNADFAHIPFGFNTYTWLYEAISDYGLIGSLIYIALCAMFVGLTWAYRHWVISVFSCYMYGWSGTAVIFTVLTNKFSSVFFTYSVMIVMVAMVLTNGLNLLAQGSREGRETGHESPQPSVWTPSNEVGD